MSTKKRNLRAIGKRRAVNIGKFAIAVVELAEHLTNDKAQEKGHKHATGKEAA